MYGILLMRKKLIQFLLVENLGYGCLEHLITKKINQDILLQTKMILAKIMHFLNH